MRDTKRLEEIKLALEVAELIQQLLARRALQMKDAAPLMKHVTDVLEKE